MTENNEKETVLTDEELGLGKSSKKQTVTKENSKSVKKTNEALQNAAATAALKAAIDANSELSAKEAEKIYTREKMKFMLDKCKTDEVVEFRGDKLYAPYFGKEYTFLYNAIPVTVKFDGSIQKFPKFIYDMIMDKIHQVSESNTPKVQIEDRTS